MEYTVVYSIDIEADSPESAAQMAHAIVTNAPHPDALGKTKFWTYEVSNPLKDNCTIIVNLTVFGNIVKETD